MFVLSQDYVLQGVSEKERYRNAYNFINIVLVREWCWIGPSDGGCLGSHGLTPCVL